MEKNKQPSPVLITPQTPAKMIPRKNYEGHD